MKARPLRIARKHGKACSELEARSAKRIEAKQSECVLFLPHTGITMVIFHRTPVYLNRPAVWCACGEGSSDLGTLARYLSSTTASGCRDAQLTTQPCCSHAGAESTQSRPLRATLLLRASGELDGGHWTLDSGVATVRSAAAFVVTSPLHHVELESVTF